MFTKTKGSEVVDALKWRYATKIFDSSSAVPEEDMLTLMEALQLSPSSMGMQPYQFFRVKSDALRKSLCEASSNPRQLQTAPEIIVFAAKTKITADEVYSFAQLGASVRGYTPESVDKRIIALQGFINSFKGDDLFHWSSNQAYIAMGQLLTAAAFIQIDACPMEGIDADAFDRILELKSLNLRTLGVVALGYRSSNDALASQPKIRKPINQLIQSI